MRPPGCLRHCVAALCDSMLAHWSRGCVRHVFLGLANLASGCGLFLRQCMPVCHTLLAHSIWSGACIHMVERVPYHHDLDPCAGEDVWAAVRGLTHVLCALRANPRGLCVCPAPLIQPVSDSVSHSVTQSAADCWRSGLVSCDTWRCHCSPLEHVWFA